MVAMNVWPTDAADGSVANEARWRKMARGWQQTGVNANVGGEMVPTLAFPNLTVKNGSAWVDGHYCELLGDQVLAVTANGLAVVRFDPAANTAELLYRDGVSTPAQSPTGVYEMPVARITGSALADVRPIAGAGYVERPRVINVDQSIGATLVGLNGFATTFNAVNGRLYEITMSFQALQTSGGATVTVNIHFNATQVKVASENLAVNEQRAITLTIPFSCGAAALGNLPFVAPGVATIQATIINNAGTTVIASSGIVNGRWAVKDVGPTPP